MKHRIVITSWILMLVTSVGCRIEADTPLTIAASKGDTREVQRLLISGADVNGRDSHSYTALMGAARNGHVETIKVLLDAGADTNARDCRTGWTPLIHAIHKNQNQAVLTLIDRGADVNAPAGGCEDKLVESGQTPLMFAAGYNNTEMVKALLERGANPYGMHGASTALSNAVVGAAFGRAYDIDRASTDQCSTATVKALLEKAPDLKLQGDLMERAAIWIAKRKGCSEIVTLLEGRRSMLVWNEGESRLRSHYVRVAPAGWLSGSYQSSSEDGNHRFACSVTTVEIKNEELTVNTKSYGRLKQGDSVMVDGDKVLINDQEVQQIASR